MHDLHEAQALLYDYSGGPPQNPNLDPILFAELPFYANWELSQFTKYGMPGVYTHAFMDGWSPGYLGSVAYNHNGMMRIVRNAVGPRRRSRCGRRGAEPVAAILSRRTMPTGSRCIRARLRSRLTALRRTRVAADRAVETAAVGLHRRQARARLQARARPGAAGAGAAGQGAGGAQGAGPGGPGGGGGGRAGAVPTGRGGGQDREWYRGLPVPPGAAGVFSRRDNTNYMETGVLSGLQLTAMFPNLVLENFYTKTKNSIEQGKNQGAVRLA